MARALRVFRYWLTLYRRTWRGTIVISIANPLLFLLGHRRRPRPPRRPRPFGHARRGLLHGLLRAGAARGVRDADGVHRGRRSRRRRRRLGPAPTVPPRRRRSSPSEILAGHLLFIAFRLLTSSAAFIAVMAVFGVAAGWWVLAALPAALLTGLAFAAPIAAWAVTLRSITKLNALFRFVLMPMYMFSGTFFALDRAAARGPADRVGPAARAGRRALPLAQPRHRFVAGGGGAHRLSAGVRRRRHRRGAHHLPPEAARVIATGWTLRRTGSLVERNALIYRRSLTPVLSSIVEPVLYLLSIGFGVGSAGRQGARGRCALRRVRRARRSSPRPP